MAIFDKKEETDGKIETAEAKTAELSTFKVADDNARQVVKTLLDNKFIFSQTGFEFSGGAMVERKYFTIRNQSGRGNVGKEIPITFCPVTGRRLDTIKIE
jgi:hypothetical protein